MTTPSKFHHDLWHWKTTLWRCLHDLMFKPCWQNCRLVTDRWTDGQTDRQCQSTHSTCMAPRGKNHYKIILLRETNIQTFHRNRFQLTLATGHWHGIPYFLKEAGHLILASISHRLSYVHDPTLSIHGTVIQKISCFFTSNSNCEKHQTKMHTC